MAALSPIHFFIDEHLPVHLLGDILTARGHQVTPVQVGFKDPAILVTAEQVGAVIMTSDTWYLRELYRFPTGHRKRYEQAGVVQVHGEWAAARRGIQDWLPVIEATYHLRRGQADRRIGIDLSGAGVRILEAKPMAPRLARSTARSTREST